MRASLHFSPCGQTGNSAFGGADIPVCRYGRDFPGRQECLPHRGENCGLAPPPAGVAEFSAGRSRPDSTRKRRVVLYRGRIEVPPSLPSEEIVALFSAQRIKGVTPHYASRGSIHHGPPPFPADIICCAGHGSSGRNHRSRRRPSARRLVRRGRATPSPSRPIRSGTSSRHGREDRGLHRHGRRDGLRRRRDPRKADAHARTTPICQTLKRQAFVTGLASVRAFDPPELPLAQGRGAEEEHRHHHRQHRTGLRARHSHGARQHRPLGHEQGFRRADEATAASSRRCPATPTKTPSPG